jgi:hypothetical protein
MESAESILLPIQFAQQEHDRLAHRDILSLDTHTRLKHMTLHFLKYAGKIASAADKNDENELRIIVIDAFIICLATANTLNVSIGEKINLHGSDLQSLAISLAKDAVQGSIFDRVLKDLVKISGRMAKAIEATDHLEDGNPRVVLETLIIELSIAMLVAIGLLEINISQAITERWRSVERKSIFLRAEAC